MSRRESPLATLSRPGNPHSGGASVHAFTGTGRRAKDSDERRVPPSGEWVPEHDHSLFRKWSGKGVPCVTCFRVWGLTDAHIDRRGICPFICREAFAPGKAPPAARPAPPRPTIGTTPASADAAVPPPARPAGSVMRIQVVDPPPDAAPAADVITPADAQLMALDDDEDWPAFRRASPRMTWPIAPKKPAAGGA